MRGEINKLAGSEQGECCGQNAGIVSGTEREAITAGAIHWPRAPHRVPHELLHFFLLSYIMVHYRQTIKLQEEHHAQPPPTPPQMPPEKREGEERERVNPCTL